MSSSTPYREKWTSDCGTVTLYLGDCLEILPTLEPGSVDAVVTDPPYGADGAISGRRRQGNMRNATDYAATEWIDTPEYIRDTVVPAIRECVRIASRVAVTPGV